MLKIKIFLNYQKKNNENTKKTIMDIPNYKKNIFMYLINPFQIKYNHIPCKKLIFIFCKVLSVVGVYQYLLYLLYLI
jgi:hypothetical protein